MIILMLIPASILALLYANLRLARQVRALQADAHPDRGAEFKMVVDNMQERITLLEDFSHRFVVRELESMRDR